MNQFVSITHNAVPRRVAVSSLVVLLVVAGCGGSNDKPQGASKSLRSDARSLQQAMDASSSAVDDVRGTRAALERVAASLGPEIAQTNDVIGVLTPEANGDLTQALLEAAREQRSFLQFAVDATRSRSRSAANSALARARTAGRRATKAYADVAQQSGELGGLLPASTTFNSGRLRDALQQVHRRRRSVPTSPGTPTTTGDSGGSKQSQSSPATSDDWPGGAAYTTILASVQSESEARLIQSKASASGLDAGVLYSTNYRSLRPGYWVVFSGTSPSKQDADELTARAKALGYSDAYPRFVSG